MGTIARLTLYEIGRKRLIWVLLALGFAYLALFGGGVWLVDRELAEAGEIIPTRGALVALLTAAGLYVIQFMVLVMALVISVDTLAGEIASGSIQTLVTKPIRRRDVVLGKFAGHALAVLVFVVFMVAAAAGLVWLLTGYRPPNLLAPTGLLVLEGWVVLSLSYALGAIMGTLANGLVVFMLYGFALVGSWIERIGALSGNEAAQYLGIAASLIMPTEALWQRAAYESLPGIVRNTVGLVSPFTAANPPSELTVVYSVAYAGLLLAIAIGAFEARDL